MSWPPPWPPPKVDEAPDFDKLVSLGLDATLRRILYAKVPTCMEEYCNRIAEWRSDDGYWFCDNCAYGIYLAECDIERVVPMGKQAWNDADRPHGPDQHHHFRTP